MITEDVPPEAPLGLNPRDERFQPHGRPAPRTALANGGVAPRTAASPNGHVVRPLAESLNGHVTQDPAGSPNGGNGTDVVGSASGRGRHAAPPTPTEVHAKRFSAFSAIGGLVFVLGLALQAVLTERFKVEPLGSYLAQAVASVEASFLLNRWLTWRDRDTPFWHAFFRFNMQKVVTIALNFALYAGLLKIGFNYLVANVVLTIVFTVVNYAAGDKLVFSPRQARTEELAAAEPRTLPMPAIQLHGPPVSVVIPCRNNDRTIGDTIESLLGQDYPSLKEVILVGGPEDSTWDGLAGLEDPRLKLIERAAPPGMRDANFKRDIGIKMTRTKLVMLVDSDIVLPRDWMSSAVTALQESGVSCVTGGMKSIHDSFWGRYTDNTVIGAKTPRIEASYLVTRENFGVHGHKPPITANALFTRELYDRCAIDSTWSHGSLEDYEWFWRVCKAGYSVLVSRDLFGWHYHRRGMRALVKEYRRSARGCAYFIKAHLDCPFAKRRLRQAILIPLGAAVGAAALAGAAAYGASTTVAALLLGCMGLLAAQQILRLRRLEAVAYPAVGLTLGLVYTARLVGTLLTAPRVKTNASAVAETRQVLEPRTTRDVLRPTLVSASRTQQAADQESRRRRQRYVLAGICGLQAALSLSLVWTNSAFGDEAEYLWIGHIVWRHWLHGAQLPLVATHLSGSAFVYPPLGALADSLGGLAGARILSLIFMLFSTLLLYSVAARLIGRRGALFAVGLWAMTEPVIRLAFATYDSMSVALTALAAWLIVQAGIRRHRGEFVVAAAVTLALANATAFSGVVADPLVMAFAFFAWRRVMKTSQAASATAWLAGSFCLFVFAALTITHSWSGTKSSIYARTNPDHQPVLHILYNVWQYSGFVIVAALIGLLTGQQAKRRQAGLLIILGLAPFLVPAGQLAEQTAWSLDKHLAYGIWFAAIAGGYAASALVAWRPVGRRWTVAACCAAALIYLAVNSWESAWNVYHAWPNATRFVSAFAPVAATTHGILSVPGQEYVAEYYLPEGSAWQRWSTWRLTLAPAGSRTTWQAYYDQQLAQGDYGAITLFYKSSSDAAEQLIEANLQSGVPEAAFTSLKGLSGLFHGEPGISDLTAALENDRDYRLVAVGSYNTETLAGNGQHGLYAIWRKV